VHVSDVARANVLAGASQVRSGAFNVGTGTRSSLSEVLQILRRLEPDHQVIHEEPRAGEVRDSVADITAITRAIGFESSVELEDGVQRYYDWDRAARGSG
jgi:UDP-glucose 4-epimerase